MKHLKILRLVSRLYRGDIVWFIHRFKMYIGLNKLISPPVAMVSKVESSVFQNNLTNNEMIPIRVVVFSHNLSYEGASISLKELFVGLLQRGSIYPTIIAFEDGPLRKEYESYGIIVKVVPSILYKISTLKRLDVEVAQLAELIKKFEAKLVFVNTLLNFPAILAAEFAKLPSIWNPRESESWDSYFRFLPNPVAQKAISSIGLPRKVVFVAQATRKVWSTFESNARFEVIHNGINLNRFSLRNDPTVRINFRAKLGLGASSIALLSVGTLCERKGQMDLVEAFTKLPDSIADRVQIILVGDDPDGYYLKSINDKCLLIPADRRHNIKIFSATQSIESFYAAADIFVLTSRVESYPRVVLEAMTFNLPIITTPVFGVLEQVIEGENAVFYSPGDCFMLSKKIIQLVMDADFRLSLGNNSFIRMKSIKSFEEMIIDYEVICLSAAI